jgi:hypothetical protein
MPIASERMPWAPYLSPEERKQVADLLQVSAGYLRSLVDRGPRMSQSLGDTLLKHAETADSLRTKLERIES